MTKEELVWREYKLEEGKAYKWSPGKNEIWVTRERDGFGFSLETKEYVDNETSLFEELPLPEDIKLTRFISKSSTISILPAMPDRPMLVKPDSSLKIMSGNEMTFYLEIPVWVQLYAGQPDRENLMTEFPVEPLSDTWFGDQLSGELAYSFQNPMLTGYHPENFSLFESICKVKVVNKSPTVLDFQRFCLHVDGLAIFHQVNNLCCNDVEVTFSSADQVSKVHYSDKKPGFLEKTEKINEARNPESNNLIRRSFSFFKSMYQ